MSVTFRDGSDHSLLEGPRRVLLQRPDVPPPRSQTALQPHPTPFEPFLEWVACLLAGEPAHMWVAAGTGDGGAAELRLLAWLWAVLGAGSVALAVCPRDLEHEERAEGEPRVVCLRQCAVSDALPSPEGGTACMHVAAGLPVNPLPWTAVCFVRGDDVPIAPSPSDLPLVASWLEACLPQDRRLPAHRRPSQMAFWRCLPRWHAPPQELGPVQTAHTDRCTEALHVLRGLCAVSPTLRMPLKELHTAFRGIAPEWWACPASSQAWARDPAVVEALNLLGCSVGSRPENKVWPRGQGRRRHSVFVHGIDLLVI